MPKTPKHDRAEVKATGSLPGEIGPHGTDSWEDDQKQHEYYYDDAHGYEVYEGNEADDDQESKRGEI